MYLNKLFNLDPKARFTEQQLMENMDLKEAELASLIARIEYWGVIERVKTDTHRTSKVYQMTPHIVDYANDILSIIEKEKNPPRPDYVKIITSWCNSHKVIAGIFAVILAGTVLLSFINNLIEVLERVF